MWYLFLLKIMWYFEREYIYVYVCISIYMLYMLDVLIFNFDDVQILVNNYNKILNILLFLRLVWVFLYI